jgi:cytochrome P450
MSFLSLFLFDYWIRRVPEQTEIFISSFCLHRNPKYFSKPDSFIPDRWLTPQSPSRVKPETITPEAYIPFSQGPANCAGRNLARQEMLMLSSLLIQKFDFGIADGFERDFERGVWEDGLRDYFVLTRGKLRVFVDKRRIT